MLRNRRSQKRSEAFDVGWLQHHSLWDYRGYFVSNRTEVTLKKLLALFLVCAAVGTLGCEEPHVPCSKTLETMPLPVTFNISREEVILGQLTVNKDGSLQLDASSTAAPAAVSTLQEAVKRMSETPTLSFTYNERTKDARYSCGGEVARGTPQFADGVRWHLYSSFYEVDTVTK